MTAVKRLIVLLLVSSLFLLTCRKKETNQFIDPLSKELVFQKDSQLTFQRPLYADTSIRPAFINATGTTDGIIVVTIHRTREDLLSGNTYNSNYFLHYVTEYGNIRLEKKRTMRGSGWEKPLFFENGSFGYFFLLNTGDVVFRFLSDDGIVTKEIDLDQTLRIGLNLEDYQVWDVIATSDNGFLTFFSVRQTFSEYDYYLALIDQNGDIVSHIKIEQGQRIESMQMTEIGNHKFVLEADDIVSLFNSELQLLNTDTLQVPSSASSVLVGNSKIDHFFIGNRYYNNNGEPEYEISTAITNLEHVLMTRDGGIIVYGGSYWRDAVRAMTIVKYDLNGLKEWEFEPNENSINMHDCLFMSQLPNGSYMGVSEEFDSRGKGVLSAFRITALGEMN